MNVTNATVENAAVTPSAITAIDSKVVSGPRMAIHENSKFVDAMATPAKSNPFTGPKRPASTPAMMEQTDGYA